MTKIVVTGIAGRMGQRLGSLTVEADDLFLVGGTEHEEHPSIGRDVGELLGKSNQDVEVSKNLEECIANADVVIAFTSPEATLRDAKTCADCGTAMVVGTTGFEPIQLEKFKQIIAKIPCVFASNFSTAMNVLFQLVEQAASQLGDEYDVEVIEMHHHFKVDAPSGSAITLGERAATGLGRNLSDEAIHGRQGVVGERSRKEIGMHAVRLGDVAGVHKVLFGAPGEYVELCHTATSRDAFALGALRAARFINCADTGLYSMVDVLQCEV